MFRSVGTHILQQIPKTLSPKNILLVAAALSYSKSKAFYAMNLNNMPHSGSKRFAVVQFPCLESNYGYLVHCEETGETATIDTPDAETIQRELDKRGWTLTKILNTHQ